MPGSPAGFLSSSYGLAEGWAELWFYGLFKAISMNKNELFRPGHQQVDEIEISWHFELSQVV